MPRPERSMAVGRLSRVICAMWAAMLLVLSAAAWGQTGNGTRRALLIGINEYQAVPTLAGALNDIAAMREILLTRWGFEPRHIRTLTDRAATRAHPGEVVIVRPGEEGTFLAAQPLAALPIDPDTHRRLRQLGLRTLGQLAALPEDAVAAQFGDPGRRLWRLAAGRTVEPVTGRPAPEPVIRFETPAGRQPVEVIGLPPVK